MIRHITALAAILAVGCHHEQPPDDVATPAAAVKAGQTPATPKAAQSTVAPIPDARVYFEFDRDEVRPGQRAAIVAVAGWLRNGGSVRLEGHADDRGSPDYNIDLGARRAANVRDVLLALGIDPARVTTLSYGEEMPAVPGHDGQSNALNRRVEFRAVP